MKYFTVNLLARHIIEFLTEEDLKNFYLSHEIEKLIIYLY